MAASAPRTSHQPAPATAPGERRHQGKHGRTSRCLLPWVVPPARASGVFAQESDRTLQLLGEAVDLLRGGGEAQAGAGRAGQSVMAVRGLGAVVAAADANARRI